MLNLLHKTPVKCRNCVLLFCCLNKAIRSFASHFFHSTLTIGLKKNSGIFTLISSRKMFAEINITFLTVWKVLNGSFLSIHFIILAHQKLNGSALFRPDNQNNNNNKKGTWVFLCYHFQTGYKNIKIDKLFKMDLTTFSLYVYNLE